MIGLNKVSGRTRGLVTLGAAFAALIQCGNYSAAHADPAPATPYPVPYNFIVDAAFAALRNIGGSAPGTNNWTCKPSAEHPEPVVLVHGFLANRNDNWQTLGPLLANNGYCVFALTYGNDNGGSSAGLVGGLASMESSSHQLDAFVDKVLAATGASKVDIVGHSEGATMPYWYIKMDHGSEKVAKMIGLAPLVHGVGIAPGASTGSNTGSANGPALAEFPATSAFMQQLDAGGITVPGVAYTQLVTRFDEVVIPYTSGIIAEPGVTNITVQDQCPQDFADHLSINSDPAAAADVLNALDPAHLQPIPCTLVLPAVGAVGSGSGGSS
ncbi:esterase/lipase family protein [Nocardia aurantia]|uniref:Lipase n=1 Tax=Nocardia aurantia TaxID=2585199 RepID=A0A7K0DYN8_9NOCA|nr:alpha/beta fold hydrolase [Nocardia aurantia]MQY30627.1 hypothetical protein [Nocardia aurantia]